MNTLPDIIQDRIYKYKHELEYKHVTNMLKASFSYCGWRGKWMLTDKICLDCWDEEETQDRMIWNGLAAGMTTLEAVRNFEEYWATIEKYPIEKYL